MDTRIRAGDMVVAVGPSKSGKSSALCRILASGRDTMVRPVESLLVISRHPEQPLYLSLLPAIKRVTFYTLGKRITESEFLLALNQIPGVQAGVLFDDVESERIDGLLALLRNLAVRLTHHLSLISFVTLHSVYYRNDDFKIFNKNIDYLVLMPQVRERGSLLGLSHSIFGGTRNPRLLIQAFDAVCAKARTIPRPAAEGSSTPHAPIPYLIVSLIPSCPPAFRLRESFDIRLPIITYQPGGGTPASANVVTYPPPGGGAP